MLTLTLQLFTESSNDNKGPDRLSAPFIFLSFAAQEKVFGLRVIPVAHVRPIQEVGLIHPTCFFFLHFLTFTGNTQTAAIGNPDLGFEAAS